MKYLLIFLLLPFTSIAQTRLPQFFGDSMVLQQNAEVAIWGTDNPGTVVKITTSWDKTGSVKTNQYGKWRLKISTPKAGGPYTLTINGTSEVTIKDLLIGEVWFCSGQSNMARAMAGIEGQPVEGSSKLISNSENNSIRVFTVSRKSSPSPLADVTGSWLPANPANTGKFSAVAYTYAKKLQSELKVPIGLIVSAWGGSSVEAWMEHGITDQFPAIKPPAKAAQLNRTPNFLYNAMVYPFLGYGIRGAIWYQGEANVPDPKPYSSYFGSMIRSWRQEWNLGNFPFYFVQVAPFDYGKYESGPLRAAQFSVMKEVANTGMAVTLDLGDCNVLHPPKKKEVGERLANWALSKTYGFKDKVASGPVFKSVKGVEDGKIVLDFDYTEKALHITNAMESGFEIAGNDRIFHAAKVDVKDKSFIRVWSEKVTAPVAVRYAYGNCAGGSLFNSVNLPAGTFRTDDW